MQTVCDQHDLSKIPYLLQHYRQHQLANTEFSFNEFLNLHYGSKSAQHDGEEHQNHKGLPFKNHDCSGYTHTLLAKQYYITPGVQQEKDQDYPNFYQSTFSFLFAANIWQPPKTA
jgi:hypothetical protein